MATYYIVHDEGNLVSADGTKRFLKLSGKQAYPDGKAPLCAMRSFIPQARCERENLLGVQRKGFRRGLLFEYPSDRKGYISNPLSNAIQAEGKRTTVIDAADP